jgi:N-acetylmuramoyl-L-alanine amidase
MSENGAKRSVDLIVIHCTASKETVDYTFEQCIKDHRARGFHTCGYHRLISKDGTIHLGRDFDAIGAHIRGYNSRSIGICYEGGLDKHGNAKDTRTEAQKESLIKCITEAVLWAQGSITWICGHRDLSPDLNGNGVVEPDEFVKECPCFSAEPEYTSLLNAF